MNSKIEKVLSGLEGNYILPFFWQHGEEEDILRSYMKVIDESNIGAVCIESRPHPDFCGPLWWRDMDIILDEARKREMKIWILDDSHFPTGFANGKMKNQPAHLQRQSLLCKSFDCVSGETLIIEKEVLNHPKQWMPSHVETMMGINKTMIDEDQLIAVTAIGFEDSLDGFCQENLRLDLLPKIKNGRLKWQVPEGSWKVYVMHVSRNFGSHENYINMMDKESCRILIDEVYETHYKHYNDDFGITIEGFFSDEPELGNGHLYEKGIVFPNYEDVPWSRQLEEALKNLLGDSYLIQLALLWEDEADASRTAFIRYTYMDMVTQLVKESFSQQIGDWCRKRGVKYIGHVIEDDNQHARLGSSLGHFYRALAGQDMAGIDNIGGQVLPGKEDLDIEGSSFESRNGEFYHYMLGKLGSSAAAIEPLKKGRAMCEIFGAYGWSEGVRLEKYLLDHFLVRGINYFVPHAFSPKTFPDPDCPPHFYAHGHNPQYRHFGQLMKYTNRVCELMNDGRHIAQVALLYHGESEWCGEVMFSHKVARILADKQVEYDIIPQDVFFEPLDYKTVIRKGELLINRQQYRYVVIPTVKYMISIMAKVIIDMVKAGIEVFFIDHYPEHIIHVNQSTEEELINGIKAAKMMKLNEVELWIKNKNIGEIQLLPANNRIRYRHYIYDDQTSIYMFVNEGEDTYKGSIKVELKGVSYIYDPWNNKILHLDIIRHKSKKVVNIQVEPMKSLLLIDDVSFYENDVSSKKIFIEDAFHKEDSQYVVLEDEWKRSICPSIKYPSFQEPVSLVLPDTLAEEKPEFSGFVRYEQEIPLAFGQVKLLEITDAHEGVEVFLNGKSQGVQVVPPFEYWLKGNHKEAKSILVIEVATTLERAFAGQTNMFGQVIEANSQSGITGIVKLYDCMNKE